VESQILLPPTLPKSQSHPGFEMESTSAEWLHLGFDDDNTAKGEIR